MSLVCRAWPTDQALSPTTHSAVGGISMPQPGQQQEQRRGPAHQQADGDDLPTFAAYCNKRLVMVDMSHFAMRMAIGLTAFFKFGSQYQPWERAVVSCCGIALITCSVWAGLFPSLYSRWREWVLMLLRVAVQAQPIVSLVVIGIMNNADPWQHRGPAGGALFLLLFTLCSGSLGAVQWALAARLPLLLHVVAQGGLLGLELSRLSAFCACRVMQQAQSQATVRWVYVALERLSSPWVWASGTGKDSSELDSHAQCWVVAAMVLIWTGYVLPTVVVAVWECEEFYKFRAATRGRYRSDWRTWLYEHTTAAPVEGGWVRGCKLLLVAWPLVGVVWDLVKHIAAVQE